VSTTLVADESELILITLVIAEIEDTTGVNIGVTVRQLRDLLTARRLPGVRRNGRWHVRRSDLPKVREAAARLVG
jgi:hypothetical protein